MITIYLLLILSAVIFWSLGYASGRRAGHTADDSETKWP
jgi:hypothetical protein